MIVTTKDVEYVARLARLHLAPDEAKRLTAQLESILEYVRQLQQLPTDAVEPTTHVVPMDNVLRADTVQPSLSPDTVVAMAPDRQHHFVRVPKVIADT